MRGNGYGKGLGGRSQGTVTGKGKDKGKNKDKGEDKDKVTVRVGAGVSVWVRAEHKEIARVNQIAQNDYRQTVIVEIGIGFRVEISLRVRVKG